MLTESDDPALRAIRHETLQRSIEIQIHNLPGGIGEPETGTTHRRDVQRHFQFISTISAVKKGHSLRLVRVHADLAVFGGRDVIIGAEKSCEDFARTAFVVDDEDGRSGIRFCHSGLLSFVFESLFSVGAGSPRTRRNWRGRLIVRELCCGIERKRYGSLNETIYHVKLGDYTEKE